MNIKKIISFLTLLIALGCEAHIVDKNGSTLKINEGAVIGQDARVEGLLQTITVRDMDIKGVIPLIDMENTKVTYEPSEISGHELAIKVDFSKFQVYIHLGENYNNGEKVSAYKTGIKDFHQVVNANEEGHKFDSDEELIIGNKFYDGGNGWTGFHMTDDVWVLKTRSGRYAKVQVLKAKAGKVDLQYAISDEFSTNLKTK